MNHMQKAQLYPVEFTGQKASRICKFEAHFLRDRKYCTWTGLCERRSVAPPLLHGNHAVIRLVFELTRTCNNVFDWLFPGRKDLHYVPLSYVLSTYHQYLSVCHLMCLHLEFNPHLLNGLSHPYHWTSIFHLRGVWCTSFIFIILLIEIPVSKQYRP